MLPRQATKAERCGPGFTLIELVVVIVIAAIVAAISVPSLGSFASTRRAMAARQMVRDLDYARERAIATGTRTWVAFATGTNSYSVLQENPASPGRAGANVLADPAFAGKDYVQSLGTGDYAGVSIVRAEFGAGTDVGFDWLGRPSDSTAADLTDAGVVTLSGGTTVTVQAVTGLVSTP